MADIFDEIAPQEAATDIFDTIEPEVMPFPQGSPTPVMGGTGRDLSYATDSSLTEDLASGFDSGVRGTGIGLAQGVLATLDFLIPGEQAPLERAKAFIQGKLKEREQYIQPIKAKYGGPGVTNPVSLAEFGGEVAPYVATGGLASGRQAWSKLPVSWSKTLGTGTAAGAAGGFFAPLEEGQSRAVSTGVGAVGGAVLGPVTRLGFETAPKVISAVERLALRKQAPEVAKMLDDPANKVIETGLRKVAPRKPSDVQSTQALAREIKNDNEAVQTIAKLRDEITFNRNGLEKTGVLPETLNEAVEATTQSASKLAERIDSIVGAAEGTKIPIGPVIGELRKITASSGRTPAQIRTANETIKHLEEVTAQGGFSTQAAIRYMAGLNNDIKGLFTGKNNSGDAPEILGLAAGKLRATLNQALESSEGGPQFAELRRSLGQLMNLENRLLKKAEQTANKEAKNQMSIFDIIAAEQLIRGVARGHFLTGPGEAISSRLAGKAFKLLNSPDRSVKQIFKAGDVIAGKARLGQPVLPPPGPKMVPDPSTGKMVPAEQAAGVRRTLGLNEGQSYQPHITPMEPSVRRTLGLNEGQPMIPKHITPVAPSVRREVVTSSGKSPLEGLIFDKTTGTWIPKNYGR